MIVTIAKFRHGAWLVFVIMPILFFIVLRINRCCKRVAEDIAAVLVGKTQKPTLKALDYAIAARHDSFEAVHVNIDDDELALLEKHWMDQKIKVPLRVIQSPYRDISVPLIEYIRMHRDRHGSEVVTVYMPQYSVDHWWESPLHNPTTRPIGHKLMLFPGVTVALVPWLRDSTRALYPRTQRPLPGQDRREEPVRTIERKTLPPAKPLARRGTAIASTARAPGAGTPKVVSAKDAPIQGEAPNEVVAAEETVAPKP